MIQEEKKRRLIPSRKKAFIIGAVAAILFIVFLTLLLYFLLTRNKVSPYIRLNSIGYSQYDSKVAVIITGEKLKDDNPFYIVDGECNRVFESKVNTESSSTWGDDYKTYELDFSELTQIGTYTIQVHKSNGKKLIAESISFRISQDLTTSYSDLLSNSLFFYRAQRDGPNVDTTVMNRKPSHLVDQNAFIYNTPTYTDGKLSSQLNPISSTTHDLSGGWADAGDYLKFVQTTSYVLDVMLLALRELTPDSPNYVTLENEILFGFDWIDRTWNRNEGMIYYQVGIGDGNDNYAGDHDLWRLPEADDQMNVSPGDTNYYVKYRPVFQTPTGTPSNPLLSPNLAGRLSAVYSLCYQTLSKPNCLSDAIMMYSLANVNSPPDQLVTTAPFDYYPESEWRDDMELAAIELYYATNDNNYLNEASKWANSYLVDVKQKDVLNLYDVSGLAHYELLKVLKTSSTNYYGVTYNRLLQALGNQVDQGYQNSLNDPFHFGESFNSDGDIVPHGFAYWLESSFYNELVGTSSKYLEFENQQRNWLLGNNAWGTSFVVGAGPVYPQCLQHQVANLVGSLSGGNSGSVLLGAVVDGPSSMSNFGDSLDTPSGANECPVDGKDYFKQFSGSGVRYVDNVAAWQSVEPAIDYSVLALYSFARFSVR